MGILLSIVVCSSCSTTSNVSVQGNPGTQIYFPSQSGVKYAGIIPTSGSLNLKIKDNTYYAYLLSKDANSDYYVPFALNYKHSSHAGTKFAEGAGMTLASIGLAGFITGGTICIINSDSPVGVPIMVGGLGLGGIGASFGAPASSRMDQDIYKYQIKYLSRQTTNGNIQITKPVYDYTPVTNEIKKQVAIEQPVNEESEKSTVSIASEKVNTSINDPSRKIVGTYVCDGSLTLKNDLIDSYENMEIIIAKKSNKVYEVTVMDDLGESFFGAPSEYKLSENKNGSYLLTNTKIPKATIRISKDGKIEFTHPRVNIDDDLYTLSLTGQK